MIVNFIKSILFIILVWLVMPLYANKQNDLFNKLIDKNVSPEVKIDILDSLKWGAVEVANKDKIKAINSLLPLVEKIPLKKIVLLKKVTILYYQIGEKETAIRLYKEAIEYASINNEVDWKQNFELGLVQIYTMEGQMDKASEILEEMEKNEATADRVKAIVFLSQADISNVKGEFSLAKKQTFKALNLHQKNGFRKGVGEAYQYLSMISYNLSEFDSAIHYSKDMFEIFVKDKDWNQMAISFYYRAIANRGLNQTEKGVKYLDSAQHYFKKGGNFGGSIDCLDKIASILVESGQLERAKGFYIEAVKLQEKGTKVYELVARYLSLAECYLLLEEYDNSKTQIDKSTKLINGNKKLALNCKLHRLSGQYYLATGSFKKAQEEFFKAIKNSEPSDNNLQASKIYFGLANTMYSTQNYLKCNEYLILADSFKSDLFTMADIQLLFAKNFKELGQFENSISAREKYAILKDSINLSQKNRVVQETLAKFQVERATDKENLAKSEKKIALAEAKLQRNMKWFGFALFGSTLLFFFILYRRSKKLREEKEKLTKLKLDAAKNTITHSKEILQNQSHLILEKNRIIKELKDNLENFFDVELGVKEEFMNLLEKRILTKEDWNDFKKSFYILYPDFVKNIENRFPNISEAELRVLCFTKLGLQKGEMADMLGVLPKSIQRTISRLKLKFEIKEDLDILCENF